MAFLQHNILAASAYNKLPHINDVIRVPHDHAADINDLKKLLDKYNLSHKVRGKLVHIHFQLKEGEVFAARDIETPVYGPITVMQAVLGSQQPSLYGYHYYVNEEGNLAAYEYMDAAGPDFSDKTDFINEFCEFVKVRGLQHKLGLSVRHGEDDVSTHELEYPAKRMCIDVPFNIALPYSEHSFETMTEFIRDTPLVAGEGPESDGNLEGMREVTKSHTHHIHCRHTDDNADNADGDGLSDGASASDGDVSVYGGKDGLFVFEGISREIELGGSKLEKSSDLFAIVSYLTDEA